MGIFMSILDFIIDNILINASMVLGLVALIGLVLQRKSVSQCISGTFKTMMGFMMPIRRLLRHCRFPGKFQHMVFRGARH